MKSVVAILAAVSVISCAPLADTPSLAPRAAEKTTVASAPPPPPPSPGAPCDDPDRATRVPTAQALAAAAAGRFAAAIAGARSTAPRESDAWIDAQTARSAATLEHAVMNDQVSALDAAVSAYAPRCDMAATIAARDAIQTVTDRQQTALDALDR